MRADSGSCVASVLALHDLPWCSLKAAALYRLLCTSLLFSHSMEMTHAGLQVLMSHLQR